MFFMSLGGWALYNPDTGAPLTHLEVEIQYIQCIASLSGKKFVFPGEDNSKPNSSSVFNYTQGVIMGSEGRPPPYVYDERNCPCGVSLNSYKEGPLCTKCQGQLLDPESHPDPFVLDFVQRYWPNLYKEREMTIEVCRIEDWRAGIRERK
ncbi:MAG: hypothetical protein A3J76_05275 [Candidatus Moranbacteria bacterium RBG_13_45_13]|nr:MAG: hypothetical protein A3J76_05275 [Candidatus Moranbacteria bacterium RBG_13_45_13]